MEDRPIAYYKWLNWYLYISDNYVKKKDILTIGNGIYKVIVIKVYKYNLWRKLLKLFGIKFEHFNCVKVREL
jgi:hypothetical protein